MKITNRFQFKVDHIDPMGQGVSKENADEKVDFILKTLPGEAGHVESYKEKGKLRFAVLTDPDQLDIKSEFRKDSPCQHYNDCHGCHFLHTSYNKEIEYKMNSFKFMSKLLKFENDNQLISTIEADERLSYRNRIQLHYDKKKKLLGFIRKDKDTIEPVPHCMVAKKEIQDKIKELYENESWIKLVKNSKLKGHIELSHLEGTKEVQIHINERYSFVGFTQVNFAMNEKLTDFILNEVGNTSSTRIIDLFGGNGNLTKKLTEHEVKIFDSTPRKHIKCAKHQTYHSIDLYNKETFNLIPKDLTCDTLIVDPPRAGIKDIVKYVEIFKPKKLIYVSCHPATMIRDIKKLQEETTCEITKLILLDLFPSTYHFEGLAILKLGAC